MVKKLEQEMLKSWGNFDTTLKLLLSAQKKKQTRRYKALIDSIDTAFFKFDEDFRVYKTEVINKECNTLEAFNATITDEGATIPAYPHNDDWMDKELTRYIDTKDLLQDELDNSGTVDIEFAIEEIKVEIDSVKSAVTKLAEDISGFEDSTVLPSVAQCYNDLIAKHRQSVDVDLKDKILAKLAIAAEPADANYSNASLRVKFSDLQKETKQLLDKSQIDLVKKMIVQSATSNIEEKVIPSTGDAVTDMHSHSLGHKPREQVFLEKTKPPKFNGDELEFPEFKRKWASQVSKAYLPEESELDKLRDNVPKEAKDQLYGVVSLKVAWEILTKRYGDKLLISKKLKSQLKSIQCVGKNDPEKIINLKVKVRNIVTRLETLEMSAALEHDSEFLSAVYTALPDRHRVRWLDYEKGENHWEAMLKFLDRAYEQANQELALLSVYKEDKSKPPPKQISSGGAQIGDSTDNNDRKEAKKKARDACGKCPSCDQFHSFQRKDGWWPGQAIGLLHAKSLRT